MSPPASMIGTNTAGGTMWPSASRQRASASTPTILPLPNSACGWKNALISPRESASRAWSS